MKRFKLLRVLIPLTFMAVIFLVATTFSFADSVSNATGQINIKGSVVLRSSASTSSKKITKIPNNETVTVIREVFKSKTSTSASNKWYYIQYGNKAGYVMTKRVDNINYNASSGKVTSKVNYRKGAGTKMTKAGTLSKGTAVTVYLKATPNSATKGSSSTWYKIKVGGNWRYVCSTSIDLVGSIFVNNVSTNTSTQNSQTSTVSYTPDADFEAFMSSQGFPESYKVKLRSLHAAHPNWVFAGLNTGIDWNTAVSKESANGVSLVSSSLPLVYRATDSNSFSSGTRNLYSSASTSKKIGTVANLTPFTLYSEVWSGTTQWSYIKTSAGTKGYIQGALYNQSYPSSISGTVNCTDSLNIRSGAGTSNSYIGSLNPGAKVEIVLQCKDSSGNIWYKIKNGSSFGYVCASYIRLGSASLSSVEVTTTTLSAAYPKAKLSENKEYRAVPNASYPAIGSFTSGQEITITASVRDSNGALWYKAYKDGSLVYMQDGGLTISGTVSETSMPGSVSGTTNTAVNYRTGAGTSYTRVNTLNGGTKVSITGVTGSGSDIWYQVSISNKTYYMCAQYVNIDLEAAPSDAAPTVTTSTEQSATLSGVSDPSSLSGTATILEGTWKAKDGSSWFNANSQTVAYYMDPRNFLNEDRVYMFEDLSYKGAYQTTTVVSKILSGTSLPGCGFSAQMFVDAGATYGVSPVHLASRARQETGGGSIAISGYKINGTVVYNPFNIGAYSGSNPVYTGLEYAKGQGWTTQTKAVYGGASFLASGYINAGQNSIYLQRFNVGKGIGNVATHQYMTNLTAPYSEAYTTKTAYASYGITNEALTFIIPIYNNMPGSTSLPQ